MKKFIYGMPLVLTVFVMFGCVKVSFDDGEAVAPPPTDPNSNVISGTISASKFYAKGTWILKGYVYVTNGATVTFEPGCVVKSDITQKGALIIERGAKLIADGKRDNPIVFTSGKDPGQRTPGD